MSDAFEVAREGPVLRVWLNRPTRRNALDTHRARDTSRRSSSRCNATSRRAS